MRKLFGGFVATAWCLVIFGFFAPRAEATEVDFACITPTACTGSLTGTVIYDGTNFKTGGTGIAVLNTQGPYNPTLQAALKFDTSLGSVTVTDGSDTLTGTITSVTPSFGSTSTVTLHVDWLSLPSAVQTFLGTPTGLDATQIIINANLSGGTLPSSGPVSLAHLGILPTPEPMSLALLGSGLILVGGTLRRRLRK